MCVSLGGNWGAGGGVQDEVQAALAQLGERQTEDLKVPGSIPGGGTFWFASFGRGAGSIGSPFIA